MKTLLKLDVCCLALTLVAYGRIAYVRAYRVYYKEQALGEALDPINFIAFVCLVLFGVSLVLLLALTVGCYFYAFIQRRRNRRA